MALLVLACSAKKIAAAAALELYQGRQYSSAFLAFANGLWQAGHQVVILSTEYGLVECTKAYR